MSTTEVKNEFSVNVYPKVVVRSEEKFQAVLVFELTMNFHTEMLVAVTAGTVPTTVNVWIGAGRKFSIGDLVIIKTAVSSVIHFLPIGRKNGVALGIARLSGIGAIAGACTESYGVLKVV